MKNKGFTLIELLIVIAIIGLTLPVLFSLFITTLQSQAKIVILQNVKKNGDSALDQINYLVQNRIYTIYSDQALTTEVCTTRSGLSTPTSSQTVYFADKGGNSFYLAQVNDKIASYSSSISPNPYYLTTPLVKVTNFVISCSRTSSYSPPLIDVAFSVSQLDSATRHENTANLDYRTKIKLRSY